MNRRVACWMLVAVCVVLFPFRSPAPLIYIPGEGWSYEPVGGEGKWRRTRAKDQLDVAQEAFDARNYSLALKSARRVVSQWPLSDYAPQAQYLVARSYEVKRQDERAFNQYQVLLEKYPKSDNVHDVLQRQFEIAQRFLGGQWFKLWHLIPLYPSMDKTATLFDKIVKSAPYSEVGPQAQMKIGAAREKQKDYPQAVKAYEKAADRYNDRPEVAAEALYRAAMAWKKQAQTAEYDQSAAGQAISGLTDFITLFPEESRVDEAQQIISSLRTEQARGSFEIARFYEKRKKWNGARIYYNEVLSLDPDSPLAPEARRRIDEIRQRLETASR